MCNRIPIVHRSIATFKFCVKYFARNQSLAVTAATRGPKLVTMSGPRIWRRGLQMRWLVARCLDAAGAHPGPASNRSSEVASVLASMSWQKYVIVCCGERSVDLVTTGLDPLARLQVWQIGQSRSTSSTIASWWSAGILDEPMGRHSQWACTMGSLD